MRTFAIAGPVNPKNHYYVPHRLDEALFLQLIEEQKYFILHAPRQSGKTTAINIFAEQLNVSGNYNVLYINVEPAQTARSNIKDGLFTILNIIKARARKAFPNNSALDFFNNIIAAEISGNSLYECLEFLSSNFSKPFILFIDEIDSLVGDTLISVLRQLRAGYPNRPDNFPQSICLIGVRDVRDYQLWSEKENSMVLGGSAFNIKAESLVLLNFSFDQVRMLYNQHSQDTGQQFTDEAIEYAFYLTQGQPWLVNALAYQACFRDVTDRSQPITKDIIERAKDVLILRRDTHIDQLVHKLKEPRVRRIIDAIIMGEDTPQNFPIDDLQYVRDLGLITQKGIKIVNPIYQEIIPRELVYTDQESMKETTPENSWYQNSDGSLNMHKLLEAFTQFYRENSDIWLEKFDYKESGPHLLLMAFLQRIINGGGKIHREYALGRKRVDLLIEFNKQKIVVELKIKRGNKTIDEGLVQIAEYMDTNNATEGHLVLFDRALGKSWDEKIYYKQEYIGNKTISVWGM